jgi:hypothetical protein
MICKIYAQRIALFCTLLQLRMTHIRQADNNSGKTQIGWRIGQCCWLGMGNV